LAEEPVGDEAEGEGERSESVFHDGVKNLKEGAIMQR